MYFVYLLRCSDDTLYTGCTNDLDRRPPAGTGHQAAHPEAKAGTDPKCPRFRPGTADLFAIIRKKLLTLNFSTDIIL